MCVRKVVVYGSSGAGKSAFASELARSLHLEHVEIDVLAYDKDGRHVAHELLRKRFERALEADAWVVEGMHRDELTRALQSADMFVWLDYSKGVVARRLCGRLLRQLVLCKRRHGRRTTARSAVERELPFIRKTLRSYDRRRGHGGALIAGAIGLGIQTHQPRSPADARRLMRTLRLVGAAEKDR